MRLARPREIARLFSRAFRGWTADSAPSMGAALAFYTLFSLAPLMVLVIAIAGFVIGHDRAQQLLLTQISGLLGPTGAQGVKSVLDATRTHRDGVIATVVGLLTLAIGATTVFAELRDDLNRVWHCKPASGGGVGLMRMLEALVSIAVAAGLFAAVFKILPSTRIEWDDVWLGSLVTAVLFWIGKYLIGLYIGKSAMASSYGAAGTLVVVIMWVYYSAQIFFYGAEFTREYARSSGSRRTSRDAANSEFAREDEAMVARARRIVRGKDPAVARPDGQ